MKVLIDNMPVNPALPNVAGGTVIVKDARINKTAGSRFFEFGCGTDSVDYTFSFETLSELDQFMDALLSARNMLTGEAINYTVRKEQDTSWNARCDHAIDMLRHPECADESDIQQAIAVACECIQMCKRAYLYHTGL